MGAMRHCAIRNHEIQSERGRAMKYFLFRLIPPRPTFLADITPAERQLMQAHAAYWRDQMAQGRVAAFGPVADPAGPYGIGVLTLEDDVPPHALAAADPTIQADAGFRFEIHAMPSLVIRG